MQQGCQTSREIFTQISKQMGEEWRAMTAEQKEPYVEMCRERNTSLRKVKEGSSADGRGEDTPSPDTTVSMKLEPELEAKFENVLKMWNREKFKDGKLRKPPQSYILYCNVRMKELTAEGNAMPFAEKSTLIGREWREMTEEQKSPYRQVLCCLY